MGPADELNLGQRSRELRAALGLSQSTALDNAIMAEVEKLPVKRKEGLLRDLRSETKQE